MFITYLFHYFNKNTRIILLPCSEAIYTQKQQSLTFQSLFDDTKITLI